MHLFYHDPKRTWDVEKGRTHIRCSMDYLQFYKIKVYFIYNTSAMKGKREEGALLEWGARIRFLHKGGRPLSLPLSLSPPPPILIPREKRGREGAYEAINVIAPIECIGWGTIQRTDIWCISCMTSMTPSGICPSPYFMMQNPSNPSPRTRIFRLHAVGGEGRRRRVDVGRPRPLCCCYVPARPWPLPRSISSVLYSVKCVVRSLDAFDLRSPPPRRRSSATP